VLTARQLLWINLMSDVAPSLGLALEPADSTVLRQPPTPARTAVFDRTALGGVVAESSVISAASLAAYGWGAVRDGSRPQANTLAFLTLTCAQLLHALSCRSEGAVLVRLNDLPRNAVLNGALVGSIGAQLLAAAVPALRRLTGIAPIGLLDLAIVTAGSTGALFVNEWRKTDSIP
jgi:P-type Ca2+ transporter type 2C